MSSDTQVLVTHRGLYTLGWGCVEVSQGGSLSEEGELVCCNAAMRLRSCVYIRICGYADLLIAAKRHIHIGHVASRPVVTKH